MCRLGGAYATGALLQQRLADRPMRVLLPAVVGGDLRQRCRCAAARRRPALRALTIVQALGVLTLVVAVPMGAVTARRRITGTEAGATVLAAVSLCGLTALFGSTPAAALTGRHLISLLLVGAAILVLLAGRGPGASGLHAAAGGGIAFGVASAVTRILSVQITDAGLTALTTPAGILAVLAVAGLNITAVWFTQQSYRHGLAAPLAVSTIANPVAAAAIGMLLLGEHLRGGAAGIALALVCTAAITGAVRRLTTAQHRTVRPGPAPLTGRPTPRTPATSR